MDLQTEWQRQTARLDDRLLGITKKCFILYTDGNARNVDLKTGERYNNASAVLNIRFKQFPYNFVLGIWTTGTCFWHFNGPVSTAMNLRFSIISVFNWWEHGVHSGMFIRVCYLQLPQSLIYKMSDEIASCLSSPNTPDLGWFPMWGKNMELLTGERKLLRWLKLRGSQQLTYTAHLKLLQT